ncbi:META domain-containing protein [Patescibacteria group bacterium]
MRKGLIIVIGILLFLGGWILMDFGETVEDAPKGTMSPEEIDAKIKDVEWKWIQFSDPKMGNVTIKDSQNYTMILNSDGTMNVKADCNNANTTYKLDNGKITVGLMAQTLAFCPEGSLSDQFLANLQAATIYFTDDDNLYFDLQYDSGTMKFE